MIKKKIFIQLDALWKKYNFVNYSMLVKEIINFVNCSTQQFKNIIKRALIAFIATRVYVLVPVNFLILWKQPRVTKSHTPVPSLFLSPVRHLFVYCCTNARAKISPSSRETPLPPHYCSCVAAIYASSLICISFVLVAFLSEEAQLSKIIFSLSSHRERSNTFHGGEKKIYSYVFIF